MVQDFNYGKVDDITVEKLRTDGTKNLLDYLEGKYIFVFPWMVGGLGTATLSNKSNAKSVKTCPLKCPTFNEAQKVS